MNRSNVICIFHHPEPFSLPNKPYADTGSLPLLPVGSHPALAHLAPATGLLDVFALFLPRNPPKMYNGSCFVPVSSVLREVFRSLPLLCSILFFSMAALPRWHQCVCLFIGIFPTGRWLGGLGLGCVHCSVLGARKVGGLSGRLLICWQRGQEVGLSKPHTAWADITCCLSCPGCLRGRSVGLSKRISPTLPCKDFDQV